MKIPAKTPLVPASVGQRPAVATAAHHPLLSLQRTLGNRTVTRLIQRMRVGTNIGASFVSGAEGALAPTLRSGKFWGADFNIKAKFDPDRIAGIDDTHYTTGEYRQYIRGYFKTNGVKNDHTLYDGKKLDATTWNEDGNGTVAPYGHRNKRHQFDKYIDKEGAGSEYEATDKPSIKVDKGERVDICLEFEGKLFKTDQASKIVDTTPLATRTWSIKGWCKKGKQKTPVIETGSL